MKKAVTGTGGRLVSSEKIRFGLVGLVNTITDFTVFNILVMGAHLVLVQANIVATTVAMAVSFVLNKKAVFRGADKGGIKQIVLFFAVTLAGLWLVQTTILAVVFNLLTTTTSLHDQLAANIAKVVGICFGLVWNYLWYSRVVFKSKKEIDGDA